MQPPQFIALTSIKPFDAEQYEDKSAPRKPAPRPLVESLTRLGQLTPLVVHRKSGRLIDGIKRLVAMRELAWDDAWVLFIETPGEPAPTLPELRATLNARGHQPQAQPERQSPPSPPPGKAKGQPHRQHQGA